MICQILKSDIKSLTRKYRLIKLQILQKYALYLQHRTSNYQIFTCQTFKKLLKSNISQLVVDLSGHLSQEKKNLFKIATITSDLKTIYEARLEQEGYRIFPEGGGAEFSGPPLYFGNYISRKVPPPGPSLRAPAGAMAPPPLNPPEFERNSYLPCRQFCVLASQTVRILSSILLTSYISFYSCLTI